jgi:hypothetical protein
MIFSYFLLYSKEIDFVTIKWRVAGWVACIGKWAVVGTCLKTEANQGNLLRDSRSQDVPDAYWLLASNPAIERWKSPSVPLTCAVALIILSHMLHRIWQLQLHHKTAVTFLHSHNKEFLFQSVVQLLVRCLSCRQRTLQVAAASRWLTQIQTKHCRQHAPSNSLPLIYKN